MAIGVTLKYLNIVIDKKKKKAAEIILRRGVRGENLEE